MPNKRFRKAVRLWHKRVGVVSALVVIFLSLTGMLLNHSPEFGLAGQSVKSDRVLALYGREKPSIRSVKISLQAEQHWLSEVGGYVYLDDKQLYHCGDALVGALQFGQQWLLACESSLVVFTLTSEVVEVIDARFGLPQPVTGLGRCEQHLCLVSGLTVYQVDLNTLDFGVTDAHVKPVAFANTPVEISAKLYEEYGANSLSWERVVLDLHAGRFLGWLGPYVMDAFALFFIFLSGTGMYIWLKTGQSKSSRRKKAKVVQG